MSWEGKSKGNVLGYKIFVFLLKNVNLSVAYGLLYFVAFYFWIFKTESFLSSYSYFRKIHGFSKVKSFFAIYRQYLELGKTLLDKTILLSGIKHKFTIEHDGIDNIEKMAQAGNGGVIISSHMGNWETAGQLLERINYAFNIVMLDDEHKKIKDYMSSVMEQKKFNIIPIKEDMSHIFLIKEALSRNELIVMHGDRFMNKSTAKQMPFMGKQAYFPTGPFFIAAKFNVPVTFAFALKETKMHYHFYASKMLRQKYNRKDKDVSVDNLMQAYIQNLEKMLKEYPYQWFNFYNFWNLKI